MSTRLGLALVLAALALPGCSRELPVPERIVVVTWDTTRADRLGCYGYDQPTSPHLDRFAEEAVLFEQAVSPVPTTLPSHSTMFTGLYPQDHGVRYNLMYRLADEAQTVAESMQEAGYRTAGFPAAMVLQSRFGLEQGFEHWSEPDTRQGPGGAPTHGFGRLAGPGVDEVLEWLGDQGEARTFVWLHFYDPHEPFDPPFPFSSQFRDRPYDGELAYTDAQFGRLMDALRADPQWDNTLVVVAGDHGEGLQDHGESWHTFLVYESTQRVPFLIRSPGAGARRVAEPVAIADLAPTVLDLAGLETPADLRGVSLRGALQGQPPPDRFLYFETHAGKLNYGWQELSGVRFGRWKLIDSSEPEIYDLASDPDELTNLVAEQPERLARFRAELARISEPVREMAAEPLDRELSPEAIAEFAALGYVAGGAGGDVSSDARTPQSQIHLETEITAARKAIATGNWSYVEEVCRYIYQRDPKNKWALTSLTTALLEQGRPNEADAFSKELFESYPKDANSYMTRGRTLSEIGRPNEAYELLQAGRRELPDDEFMGYLLVVAGFDAEQPVCGQQIADITKQFPRSGRIRMLNARCTLRGPRGVEGALDDLLVAVALGYRGRRTLLEQEEFKEVVAHERFQEILKEMEGPPWQVQTFPGRTGE